MVVLLSLSCNILLSIFPIVIVALLMIILELGDKCALELFYQTKNYLVLMSYLLPIMSKCTKSSGIPFWLGFVFLEIHFFFFKHFLDTCQVIAKTLVLCSGYLAMLLCIWHSILTVALRILNIISYFFIFLLCKPDIHINM